MLKYTHSPEMPMPYVYSVFFFFNDTATTEIYTLSLHDALPIWCAGRSTSASPILTWRTTTVPRRAPPRKRSCSPGDRKSTRLNSSHSQISYAVFCLKKKKDVKLIGLSLI